MNAILAKRHLINFRPEMLLFQFELFYHLTLLRLRKFQPLQADINKYKYEFKVSHKTLRV